MSLEMTNEQPAESATLSTGNDDDGNDSVMREWGRRQKNDKLIIIIACVCARTYLLYNARSPKKARAILRRAAFTFFPR